MTNDDMDNLFVSDGIIKSAAICLLNRRQYYDENKFNKLFKWSIKIIINSNFSYSIHVDEFVFVHLNECNYNYNDRVNILSCIIYDWIESEIITSSYLNDTVH